MINIAFEPTQLNLDQINSVTIRLSNSENKPCTHVRLRLRLPPQIVLLEGTDQVDIGRIDPGQNVIHTLRVRPKQIGYWIVDSSSFSYRDSQGQSQHPFPFQQEVKVIPVTSAPIEAVKPINHANIQPADQSGYSGLNGLNNFVDIRLYHLADNIYQDLLLLKDYENELRYEDDPRRRAKYRREIEQLRESATLYKQEYEELSIQMVNVPSNRLQDIAAQLLQMDVKLNTLLSGQSTIGKQLKELRQQVLARFDISEQTIIAILLEHLNESQILTVHAVVDAVEGNRLAENELQEIVVQLKQWLAENRERISSHMEADLSGAMEHASEVVTAPSLDIKHKLKIAAPIIPMILSYEGEIELGSGLNLEAAWQRLVAKVVKRK